jgi:signal transduction histidine kinase
MRLADFIDRHAEDILVEWERFAATKLPAAAGMETLALRDHAPLILQAIATDLRTAQSAEQQRSKAEGGAVVLADAPSTAAEAHGAARAQSGFNLNQMVSEYRALRASVLRLWRMSGDLEDEEAVKDIIRFGEAIDQAIAESVDHFSAEIDRARNLFLGMLGHELRNPLNAIQVTAQQLARSRSDEIVSKAAQRLIDSGARMQALLDDLLDYSRTTLAVGIKVEPAPVDFGELSRKVCDELGSVHPHRTLELQMTGELRGSWDPGRIQQVLSNLLQNALTYGDGGAPVILEVQGAQREICVQVKNQGAEIPAEALPTLFDPLSRGVMPDGAGGDTHLGLGLFIARQIVKAHRGEIHVRSEGGETVFSVRLPRAMQ